MMSAESMQIFDAMISEWTGGGAAKTREEEFGELADQWRAVEWKTGGSTLLAALGLQYQEVPLCRGLAWILDPAGGHRLGRHLFDALVASLGLPAPSSASAITIVVEETRNDTRADVILRYDQQTVIIEAKVLAGEQPRQADRLSTHWAELNPTLVFLTRTGRSPATAVESVGRWTAMSWRDIAVLARRVVSSCALEPSAGAREYIETIGAL